MPTYSPDQEASGVSRPLERLTNAEIQKRLRHPCRSKPSVYFDCIDSVMNNPTPVNLVVADGRSTESIRDALKKHHKESYLENYEMSLHQQVNIPRSYTLELYPEKMSQWVIFNDLLQKYATEKTEYVVYTSSDVVWTMDFVAEAVKEFEADPALQIVFPCVSRGDVMLPCQIARVARDLPLVEPPFQRAARAPVLNMYAAVFRMEFFKTYGGYPDTYRNCFTESFLHYMCEAMGGKMRLMPRGHVYHHSAVDAWQENGSFYYYHQEKDKFDAIMDRVMAARIKKEMTVDFLKSQLYA